MISSLCSRLGVEMRSDAVAQVTQVVRSGEDRDLLKILRDEATTCVLMVRLENEQRKAEWEARSRTEEFDAPIMHEGGEIL
jgi:DNA-binding MarR family transcriptional regulator